MSSTISVPLTNRFLSHSIHNNSINNLLWNENHSEIFSASRDATIGRWRLQKCKICGKLSIKFLDKLIDHSSWINTIDYWNDFLLSGSSDETVKIWKFDENDGNYLLADTFTQHHDQVNEIKCMRQKNLFVSSSMDSTIRVTHLDGMLTETILLPNRSKSTNRYRLDNLLNVLDQSKFDMNGKVQLEKLETNRFLKKFNRFPLCSVILNQSTNIESSYSLETEEESGTVYSGHIDGKILVWDIRQSNLIKELFQETRTIHSLKKNHQLLTTISADGFLTQWDMRKMDILSQHRLSEICGLKSLIMLDEGKSCYVGESDGSVQLFSFHNSMNESILQEHSSIIDLELCVKLTDEINEIECDECIRTSYYDLKGMELKKNNQVLLVASKSSSGFNGYLPKCFITNENDKEEKIEFYDKFLKKLSLIPSEKMEKCEKMNHEIFPYSVIFSSGVGCSILNYYQLPNRRYVITLNSHFQIEMWDLFNCNCISQLFRLDDDFASMMLKGEKMTMENLEELKRFVKLIFYYLLTELDGCKIEFLLNLGKNGRSLSENLLIDDENEKRLTIKENIIELSKENDEKEELMNKTLTDDLWGDNWIDYLLNLFEKSKRNLKIIIGDSNVSNCEWNVMSYLSTNWCQLDISLGYLMVRMNERQMNSCIVNMDSISRGRLMIQSIFNNSINYYGRFIIANLFYDIYYRFILHLARLLHQCLLMITNEKEQLYRTNRLHPTKAKALDLLKQNLIPNNLFSLVLQFPLYLIQNSNNYTTNLLDDYSSNVKLSESQMEFFLIHTTKQQQQQLGYPSYIRVKSDDLLMIELIDILDNDWETLNECILSYKSIYYNILLHFQNVMQILPEWMKMSDILSTEPLNTTQSRQQFQIEPFHSQTQSNYGQQQYVVEQQQQHDLSIISHMAVERIIHHINSDLVRIQEMELIVDSPTFDNDHSIDDHSSLNGSGKNSNEFSTKQSFASFFRRSHRNSIKRSMYRQSYLIDNDDVMRNRLRTMIFNQSIRIDDRMSLNTVNYYVWNNRFILLTLTLNGTDFSPSFDAYSNDRLSPSSKLIKRSQSTSSRHKNIIRANNYLKSLFLKKKFYSSNHHHHHHHRYHHIQPSISSPTTNTSSTSSENVESKYQTNVNCSCIDCLIQQQLPSYLVDIDQLSDDYELNELNEMIETFINFDQLDNSSIIEMIDITECYIINLLKRLVNEKNHHSINIHKLIHNQSSKSNSLINCVIAVYAILLQTWRLYELVKSEEKGNTSITIEMTGSFHQSKLSLLDAMNLSEKIDVKNLKVNYEIIQLLFQLHQPKSFHTSSSNASSITSSATIPSSFTALSIINLKYFAYLDKSIPEEDILPNPENGEDDEHCVNDMEGDALPPTTTKYQTQ
ncbi:hypothetical protein SNEBB_008405 [Seison nebaliae]|nr:hypothetical protein SNEBB_008405 [Seison nebaliae]